MQWRYVSVVILLCTENCNFILCIMFVLYLLMLFKFLWLHFEVERSIPKTGVLMNRSGEYQ